MSVSTGAFRSFRTTLEMIKFSHTLFALPFALLAAFLAAGGWPRTATLVKILLAMIGARSAAMAHNRLADRKLDAANPRTAARELINVGQGGKVSEHVGPLADAGAHPLQALMSLHVIFSTSHKRGQAAMAAKH